MKTLIAKSIMLLVIIIGLVHYALYLKTGKLPWGEGWHGPSISLPKSLPSVDSLVPSSKTRVYKWVDEHGVINYSQEPPPANLNVQTMDVDPNVNIILSTPLPEKEPDDTQKPQSVLLGGPEGEEKTPLEKAMEAKELLEARDRKQKKILDNI